MTMKRRIMRIRESVRVEDLILEDGDFIELLESPDKYIDRDLYEEYVSYCDFTDYGTILYEGKITDSLKKVIEFVKSVAKEMGCKIRELFKLVKDKWIFAFFSELGWNLDSLAKVISAGTKILSTIMNPLGSLINLLFPDLAKEGYKKLMKSEAFRKIRNKMGEISDWIKKNKKILYMSGMAFAGIYFVIWMTMNNTGDYAYDYEISDLFNALTGKLTFVDWISGEEGIKQIILFILGVSTGGLAINVAQNMTQLVISVIRVFAEKLEIKLKKGKDSNSDIEKEAKALA